jgi:hypothetical protein
LRVDLLGGGLGRRRRRLRFLVVVVNRTADVVAFNREKKGEEKEESEFAEEIEHSGWLLSLLWARLFQWIEKQRWRRLSDIPAGPSSAMAELRRPARAIDSSSGESEATVEAGEGRLHPSL